MTDHRWRSDGQGYRCAHCSTFARVGEYGELVIRTTAAKREPGGAAQ